jgi:hypothetical protein
VELTPELNSGQALQGFINWFKQAKTISSLKAEFQFSDSLEFSDGLEIKLYFVIQSNYKVEKLLKIKKQKIEELNKC